MLALRSVLAIPAADAAAATAASTSAADAVLLDLAAPTSSEDRATARKSAAQAIEAIGVTRRPVLARVSAAASGQLEADLAAVVGLRLSAVVLSATELPQDARDADVLLRRYEWRHRLTPGVVRLIPEIDSAAGLQSLPTILEAVDRHSAVALNPAHLHHNLGLAPAARDPHDQLMTTLAVAARAADLPWLLATFEVAHTPVDPARAHQFGASGAVIHSEAAARGVNSLFTPAPASIEAARAIIDAWAHLRESGGLSGVATSGEQQLPVDRRSVRHARLVLANADAIAARTRVK
jgi:citrate lyase subunit beta / citryl-CoA lyase